MKIHAVLLFVLPLASVAGGLPFAHYGLLDTPSAHLLQHTEAALSIGGTAYSTVDSAGNSDMNIAVAGYLEIGLFGRAQIGATYLGAAGISGTVRALVLRETLARPGIALGVENLIGEKDYEFYRGSDDSLYHYPVAQNYSVYGVITKDFSYFLTVPVCLNLGFGTGRFTQSADVSEGLSTPVPGFFGSINTHPTMAAEAVLEWDGRDLNAGVTYSLNRRFSVMGAVSEIEHFFMNSDSTTTTSDVMTDAKYSLAVQFILGPFMNRTELDPYQKLRFTEDDEAVRQLQEYRQRGREEIQELESYIH